MGKAARGCHSPLSGKFPARGGELSLTQGLELSWLPGCLAELLLQEAYLVCVECVYVCMCDIERKEESVQGNDNKNNKY